MSHPPQRVLPLTKGTKRRQPMQSPRDALLLLHAGAPLLCLRSSSLLHRSVCSSAACRPLRAPRVAARTVSQQHEAREGGSRNKGRTTQASRGETGREAKPRDAQTQRTRNRQCSTARWNNKSDDTTVECTAHCSLPVREGAPRVRRRWHGAVCSPSGRVEGPTEREARTEQRREGCHPSPPLACVCSCVRVRPWLRLPAVVSLALRRNGGGLDGQHGHTAHNTRTSGESTTRHKRTEKSKQRRAEEREDRTADNRGANKQRASGAHSRSIVRRLRQTSLPPAATRRTHHSPQHAHTRTMTDPRRNDDIEDDDDDEEEQMQAVVAPITPEAAAFISEEEEKADEYKGQR